MFSVSVRSGNIHIHLQKCGTRRSGQKATIARTTLRTLESCVALLAVCGQPSPDDVHEFFTFQDASTACRGERSARIHLKRGLICFDVSGCILETGHLTMRKTHSAMRRWRAASCGVRVSPFCADAVCLGKREGCNWNPWCPNQQTVARSKTQGCLC